MADLDAALKLEERKTIRKGLNGLRNQGLIPAVIYNHGQDSIHVMGSEFELSRIYQAAGKHHPLNLQVGSEKYFALIKDVQFNPVKRRMQHIVFQAINRNEKVEAEIPVRIEGEIPAEKVGLLVLNQLDSVQVEALPRELPNELFVDGTKLVELHDKLIVSDIKAPSGVTILTDPEHPIATVVETRAHAAEEAEEEASSDETEDQTSEGAEAEAGQQPSEKNN